MLVELVAVGVAEAVLGEGGGVGVVRDDDRNAEAGREDALQVLTTPAEVGGGEDDSREVDDAGGADPEPQDGPGGLGDEQLGEADDERRGIRAGRPREGQFCAVLDLPQRAVGLRCLVAHIARQ